MINAILKGVKRNKSIHQRLIPKSNTRAHDVKSSTILNAARIMNVSQSPMLDPFIV